MQFKRPLQQAIVPAQDNPYQQFQVMMSEENNSMLMSQQDFVDQKLQKILIANKDNSLENQAIRL